MKIYAKQVPPEYQESPAFMFGLEEMYPGVIFDGNRNYKSHTTPEYDYISRYFEEMAGEWENDGFYYEWAGSGYKKIARRRERSIGEMLHDYGFTRSDGKTWSNKQKHAWRLLMEYDGPDSDYIILGVLQLMTGKAHETTTIRGCCQGDWQEIIYPAEEYNQDDIERIEADYFNTGSEWIVHDESSDPETPEDIDLHIQKAEDRYVQLSF